MGKNLAEVDGTDSGLFFMHYAYKIGLYWLNLNLSFTYFVVPAVIFDVSFSTILVIFLFFLPSYFVALSFIFTFPDFIGINAIFLTFIAAVFVSSLYFIFPFIFIFTFMFPFPFIFISTSISTFTFTFISIYFFIPIFTFSLFQISISTSFAVFMFFICEGLEYAGFWESLIFIDEILEI